MQKFGKFDRIMFAAAALDFTPGAWCALSRPLL